MGKNGTALFGQAGGPRTKRERQPPFCRSGALDVRTGRPWRDLPAFFGNWNTVFKRYRDWIKADVFMRLFEACSEQPDMEYAMVDATIVKVHRRGQGAKGGRKARPSAAPRAA